MHAFFLTHVFSHITSHAWLLTQIRRILASYLLVTGGPPGPLGPHSAGAGALHGLLEEACPGGPVAVDRSFSRETQRVEHGVLRLCLTWNATTSGKVCGHCV
jgi:hypothetical protein